MLADEFSLPTKRTLRQQRPRTLSSPNIIPSPSPAPTRQAVRARVAKPALALPNNPCLRSSRRIQAHCWARVCRLLRISTNFSILSLPPTRPSSSCTRRPHLTRLLGREEPLTAFPMGTRLRIMSTMGMVPVTRYPLASLALRRQSLISHPHPMAAEAMLAAPLELAFRNNDGIYVLKNFLGPVQSATRDIFSSFLHVVCFVFSIYHLSSIECIPKNALGLGESRRPLYFRLCC